MMRASKPRLPVLKKTTSSEQDSGLHTFWDRHLTGRIEPFTVLLAEATLLVVVALEPNALAMVAIVVLGVARRKWLLALASVIVTYSTYQPLLNAMVLMLAWVLSDPFPHPVVIEPHALPLRPMVRSSTVTDVSATEEPEVVDLPDPAESVVLADETLCMKKEEEPTMLTIMEPAKVTCLCGDRATITPGGRWWCESCGRGNPFGMAS